MTDSKVQPITPHSSKCALCAKPVVHDFRPFCSKRCKDVDLGNWMLDRYAIEGEEESAFDDSSEANI